MVSVENSGRYDIDLSRQRRAGRSPYATWQLHATTGRRWPRPRTPRPPQLGRYPHGVEAKGAVCLSAISADIILVTTTLFLYVLAPRSGRCHQPPSNPE